MLEFSRRNQEDQIVKEMEEEVKQLTQEQADLEVGEATVSVLRFDILSPFVVNMKYWIF